MSDLSMSEIVAKLTPAQRAVVASAIETRIGRWRCQNAGRVQKRLVDLGLAYLAVPNFAWRSDRRNVMLTPLGEQVRAALARGESK